MLRKVFTILILLFCSSTAFADLSFIDQPQVQTFIHDMVRKHQFNEASLIRIFDSVKIRPQVIKSIKAPLEQKPWYSYQMLFVTEWRIREGVKFWNKHQDALQRAEKMFGVPASIIVATIGVETKYGTRMGNFRVIDALSNLAFSNTPRAAFFRNELEAFLLLSREQDLNPLTIKGSYAGAIGQPQFMPSSYRRFAINFSGYPKIDLSNDDVDVIGSVANYYNKHGWQTGQSVIIPASIQKINRLEALLKNNSSSHTYSKAQLLKYGINPKGMITNHQKVSIVQLRSYFRHEYWLGFPNFDVIKRYNNSDLYAMAVYRLSYYITALREKTNNV